MKGDAMRRLLFLLLLPVSAYAAETLTLNTPESSPSITTWQPVHIILNREGQRIDVRFKGSAGETRTCSEIGAAAVATMTTLNKANLTANSLEKRTITWAQALGCLGAGSVTGSPD